MGDMGEGIRGREGRGEQILCRALGDEKDEKGNGSGGGMVTKTVP